MRKLFRCKLSICVAQANPSFDTQQLFDAKYKEPVDSPISEFLLRLQRINTLAPQPNQFDSLQGQLVLLGAIAAVESYLRTLLRRLISVDPGCEEIVHKCDVSFGAAIHLKREMMPEAILERISFVNRSSIVGALRELLGVKGNLPSEVDVAISDYARICQLRHCAVHRFGKLGVSNAIALGLDDHNKLLEKPLVLDYVALQDAIGICTGFVKTLNNFLFNEILSRIPAGDWTGNYQQDKEIFKKYYTLFADKVGPSKSAAPNVLYKKLQRQHLQFAAGKPF